MSVSWNVWHGCHKKSEGCAHCYVHRRDALYDLDLSHIKLNKAFDLPVRRGRDKQYKVKSGEQIYTCFTSDFLLAEADEWRIGAWEIIRKRRDCHFLFLTKRIERFFINLPTDWGDGWDHVTVGCTCENQARADERLPTFTELPIKHKIIVCEPLLSHINIIKYLSSDIQEVSVGGESGPDARVCDYNWVLGIRKQCTLKKVPFCFRQTGARLLKDGKLYCIKRGLQHDQARKAGINYRPGSR